MQRSWDSKTLTGVVLSCGEELQLLELSETIKELLQVGKLRITDR